ncbi:MAG: tRNA pseudouridine(55) synthase TruB, partial [Anaerolineales bacterium]
FEKIHLLPNRYLQQFFHLPFEHIGIQLGQWNDECFEPSLPFISRFGHQFTRGMFKLKDEEVKLWTQGRDIRQPETDLIANGQFLMVTDCEGRNLGLGKLLPKRLRNLLPRQLF